MEKTSLKNIILQKLREKWKGGSLAFYHHQQIEDKLHEETHYKKDSKIGKQVPFHYTHANINRQLRLLEQDKLIEKFHEEGKNPDSEIAIYRYIPTPHELSSHLMLERLKVNN